MDDALTSKQRAYLKGLASNYETIFQVGKYGLSDEQIFQLDNALKARELIKIRVLEAAGVSAKEISVEIAELTRSQVVQVIGSKIVLYRRNRDPKKRVIDLA